MTRRTFLLMGIAILAVVFSHAAGWGEIAMINWADRYRPVAVPNYDMVGSFSYDLLVVMRQLVVWAVPAFLFCSGFFVAYAARGARGNYSWKMARTRVIDLLIPYTIWSLTWFIADALQGKTFTLGGYLSQLITGQADGGSYFFIPMLCQFYLLSPLIVPIAKVRPKQLIAIAAMIQLGGFVIQYLSIFGYAVPGYVAWVDEAWLFFMWTTYFALGLVCGFHGERIKQAVLRYKWILISCIVVFGVISIFEAEAIYWLTFWTRRFDVRYVPFTFSTWWYSIAFLLAFLVFDKISIPFPARLNQLGSKSYGIYLIELVAMEYVARILRLFTPGILAYQVVLFVPIMFVVGLGVPLLLMAGVARSPIRKYYRYLFG